MKQMIRFQLLLILLCLTVSAFSCSGDDPAPDPELTVSVESLAFGNASETKSFHIKTNVAWSISASGTWCTVSPASGDNAGTIKIDITAAANTTTSARNAVITVVAGNLSKQVTVTQDQNIILTVNPETIEVPYGGQEVTVTLQSAPGITSISISPDYWITQKSSTTFTVAGNLALFAREGKITFSNGKLSKEVTVKQSGCPLNIAADQTGVSSNAVALAGKMKTGWNVGNSLEASSATSANETLWGNPMISRQLINAVKAAGFNAIRIPCAWNGYIEDQATYKIKDTWLARVKEVVDYCLANDMYAIINIHWDGGWLEENPVYAKQDAVNKKQKALWEQIAVYFRDYDEHLLFAGTNEVHAGYGTPTAENITVQLSFNQTFVNAVRSTGGRNASRNLVVQAYNTNIDLAVQYLAMPTDNVAGRLMAEVHYYDPWDFCGEDGTGAKYLWGKDFAGQAGVSTWGQESYADAQFDKMKTNFINKGIPVVLGEYSPTFRASLTGQALTDHIKSRNYYLQYITKAARDRGIVPFYWDNGNTGNLGSGLFNRLTGEQVHPDAIGAITVQLGASNFLSN